MGRRRKEKQIIGKTDFADFPVFGLSDVAVKIDSGAYTSTIDCLKIEEKNDLLEVVFLRKTNKSFTGEKKIFDKYSVKRVRSSSGESQLRFTVKGTILLFDQIYKTEFTLSKRKKMRYPVLLGRKLLNKHFLIDTSLKDVSIKLKNKNTE